jgi:Bacterial Ig-like domain (group 1)
MNIRFSLVFFVAITGLLMGCNVEKPANLNSDTRKIILELSSLNQVDGDSFPNTDVITLKAILLDAASKPLVGELVTFSTTLGNLAATTGLTNANGEATATMTATTALGGGTATATYTATNNSTVTQSKNFELLSSTTVQPTNNPRLTLSLLQNNLAVNRFRSNETAELQATLVDATGAPIANQIISFSTELATLSTASALTSNLGVAKVTLSATATSLGAAAVTALTTVNTVPVSAQLNYEIISANTNVTNNLVRLGYFDTNNQFVEGQLGVSITPDANGQIHISAGGTLGVSLALVDQNTQRIMSQTQVNFTSTCVAGQRATLGAQAFTVNGVANSTYEDLRCGGGTDVIVASVAFNSQTLSVNRTINIASENIGSIEFVSAVPESIVLKGTGGLGKQETSTLTFLVKGNLGNPLGQQTVNFSLNTSVGGLELSPASSLTNSVGLVTTKVTAGNIPTAVRVTASVTANAITIQTQSDLLSVNTGLPDQDSFSLAHSVCNPEANNYDGETSTITARLSDAFNNPVPDGTTVNFTTEGGSIVPSCNTLNGVCSVVWSSSEPRVSDRRITIVATAVGHETFYDTNGNNTFDDNDGVGFSNTVQSGFGRLIPAPNGFFDMAEAWRDDNENLARDSGEIFIDFDNDQTYDAADLAFNGPQCQGTLCSARKSVNVRKAIQLAMAGSAARLTLISPNCTPTVAGSNPSLPHLSDTCVRASNDSAVAVNESALTLAEDATEEFQLLFADFATPYGHVLPSGTQVEVSVENGTLSGTSSFTVPNSCGVADKNDYGGQSMSFLITNPNTATSDDDTTKSAIVTIKVTTPKGDVTDFGYVFTLMGD